MDMRDYVKQHIEDFIPNVIQSVEGEKSLANKIESHIDVATDWVRAIFTGEESLQAIAGLPQLHPLKTACVSCIVCEAFRLAVPSLDLVLTPNGFGIVNNSNIAPASKERIERLIKTLLIQRDKNIALMLQLLPDLEEWADTEQHEYFYTTLFPTLDLPKLCGVKENLWDEYKSLRAQVAEIENRIAYHFLSFELLDELRAGEHPTLKSKIQSLVLSIHFGAHLDFKLYADVLNDIRKDKVEYKTWHESETAKRFNDTPIFVNKKESNGYWF